MEDNSMYKKSLTSRSVAMVTAFLILLIAASCDQTIPIPNPTAAPTIQPGDTERKLTVNDLERSYLLHIPPGLNSQQPLPVVFAFHDGWGTPMGMRSVSGFNDVAYLGNFLVVYPEGIFRTWNAGDCCGYAMTHNVDEPAFIRQMLSDLDTFVTIDSKRIYAVGYGNGGMLVYRLACEMSETFAAIAAVAGVADYSPCQPQQVVSVIHVHGLADTLWPYAGGSSYDFPPVEQVIANWVQLAGCTGSPQVERLQNIITHTTHATCQAGTAVELYSIDLLQHGWPSKTDFLLSQIIWDFFTVHPKP
jgi:polyhydroxybutyrate depolymerase